MIKKLKIYAQGSHPHSAQQPKALSLQSAQARAA
jgi:ribosomal protein L13